MEKLRAFIFREKCAKTRSDNGDRDTATRFLIDNANFAKMKRSRVSGDNSQFFRNQTEKWRGRSQGLRSKIYSKIPIPPLITKTSYKDLADISRIPLVASESSMQQVPDRENTVMLEAGLTGDTWTYCVERERLARKSEWFRAMLTSPLTAPTSDSPPLRLRHVDKRAFEHFLRYLHDKPVNFISVSTARATLDAAHQYLCPGLARLVVSYLEAHLTPSTVLEIYQGLGLYANDLREGEPGFDRSPDSPSAPPPLEDDVGVIAVVCTNLLLKCLSVIDSNSVRVLQQEYFEELSAEEIAQLARRDTLNIKSECILFSALDRWAVAECRRQGVEPLPINKRAVLTDDVCFSVRYLFMNDQEFVNGPMASGILTNDECVYIVSKILRHPESPKNDNLRSSAVIDPSRLSNVPRIVINRENEDCSKLRPGKKERQDNRKNRRRECVSQGQKTCAVIGECLLQILACVFD